MSWMIGWRRGVEARAFLCVLRDASPEGACSWKVVGGACFELQFAQLSRNSNEQCRFCAFHTKEWASRRDTFIRQGL